MKKRIYIRSIMNKKIYIYIKSIMNKKSIYKKYIKKTMK